MDATQFAYWLQGYSEITQGQVPTPAQWQIIQDHLKLVFTKVTPHRTVEQLAAELNKATLDAMLQGGRVYAESPQQYCAFNSFEPSGVNGFYVC